MKTLCRWMLALMWISLFSGCTYSEFRNEHEAPEVIQAFFIADNTLYAIGKLNSYRFKSDPKENAGTDTTELIQFLQDKARLAKVESVELATIRQKMDENQVISGVIFHFMPNAFSEAEEKQLEQEYGFSLFPSNNTANFSVRGEIVQLENREALLKQTALRKPLSTTLITYSEHQHFDKEGTKMLLEFGLIGVPFVVITAPIWLPFALIAALA